MIKMNSTNYLKSNIKFWNKKVYKTIKLKKEIFYKIKLMIQTAKK